MQALPPEQRSPLLLRDEVCLLAQILSEVQQPALQPLWPAKFEQPVLARQLPPVVVWIAVRRGWEPNPQGHRSRSPAVPPQVGSALLGERCHKTAAA